MSFCFRSVSDVSDGRLMVMFELIVTERASCMVFPPRRRQSEIIIYRFAMSSFLKIMIIQKWRRMQAFFGFSGERTGANLSRLSENRCFSKFLCHNLQESVGNKGLLQQSISWWHLKICQSTYEYRQNTIYKHCLLVWKCIGSLYQCKTLGSLYLRVCEFVMNCAWDCLSGRITVF